MKKSFFICFLFLMAYHSVSASDFDKLSPSGQFLYYKIVDNVNHKVAVVHATGYTSWDNPSELIIPSTVVYEGVTYTVTELGEEPLVNGNTYTYYSVFLPYNNWIHNLVIPNTVTTIRSHAFKNCTNLSTITIPSSVITIESQAFSGCTSLTQVTIPSSVSTLESGAFANCSGLTSVIINADSIYGTSYNSPFQGCNNLTVATIGNTVRYIPSNLFQSCSGLTTVNFNADSCVSAGESYIANRPFMGCSNLTTINIGTNVKCIPQGLFKGCNKVEPFTVPNGVVSIGDNAFFRLKMLYYYGNASGSPWGALCVNGYVEDSIYYTSSNKDTLTGVHVDISKITIPNGVQVIKEYAFNSCTNSPIVVIPKTIIHIDNNSFNNSGIDTVIFKRRTPIPLSDVDVNMYWDVSKVGIPCGALSAYQSVWNVGYSQFDFFETIVDTILLQSNGYGYVEQFNTSNCSIWIQAIADYGYHFLQWNDNITDNPRLINLEQDTLFVATFDRNTYDIVVIPNDTNRGVVNGCGTYLYLDSAEITAAAKYGYHFDHWQDGNTENPRTIVLSKDTSIVAFFAPNQYILQAMTDSLGNGIVYGSGFFDYQTQHQITAHANTGYHFSHWDDGDSANPRLIQLTQDTIFYAHFSRSSFYVLGTTSNNERGSVWGSDTVLYLDTVTLTAVPNYGYYFTHWDDGNNTNNPRQIIASGNIVRTAYFEPLQFYIALNVDSSCVGYGYCTGSGQYNYLSNRSIMAHANYGYHFSHWSDGDTTNPRTIILTQDTALTSLFAKNQYTLTLQSEDVEHGGVIGGGVFEYLDTVAIEATSVEHYHFVQWNDGNTDNPRQYVITRDDTIIATFAIDTHHVSVESFNIAFGSVGGGGDFEYGTPATVTATGYSGYQFVRWSDGSTYNPYTFAVLHDTTLVAIFEAETQGIDDVIADAVNVYALGGQIVVVTEIKDEISIYDIVGRKVDGGRKNRFEVPASGVYLVTMGSLPPQKVVVVK